MEQTHDQQRLGDVETEVGILKSTDAAFAKLLEGIATTLKELKATSYPPFGDTLRNFGIGAALMTSVLIGNSYLVSNQISEATQVAEYRLRRVEEELKEFKEKATITYTWRTATETK